MRKYGENINKKIISYLVIMCFVGSIIGSIPVKVKAETSVPVCSVCQQNATVINTYEELCAITNMSGCYILGEDIDLKDKTFTSIGSSSNPFTGHFDGNYHKITNLSITGSSSMTGFFGKVYNATVKNLGIENANVVVSSYDIGILTGNSNMSTISNCYVTGSVQGIGGVGGIAGSIHSGSTIENCYSKVTVKGTRGTLDVGGISGWNPSNVIIKNCYTVANGQKRAVSGWSDGTALTETTNLLNSYYDNEVEKNSPAGVTTAGRTTAQMKDQATFTGWNFDTIWAIDSNLNEGYPYIKGFAANQDSITITPTTVAVTKGNQVNFAGSVKIAGIENPNQLIEWSISGNTSNETTINNTGILSVSAQETSGLITVTAKATVADATSTGTVTENKIISATATAVVLDIKDAETPKFGASNNGESTYLSNSTAQTLNSYASVSDGGVLTYQWYKNTTLSTEGAQLIDGAINSAYTPETDAEGTYYYFVKVTNTNTSQEITGATIKEATSDIHKVTVLPYYGIVFQVNGGVMYQNPPESYNQLMEGDIILGTPSKIGYTFAGWYENENLTGEPIVKIASGQTGNKTFYAKWNQEAINDGDYLISGNKNGDWYNSNATITPANGYKKIGVVNNEGLVTQWKDSLEYSSEFNGSNSIKIKLQKEDLTETTERNITEIKIDKTTPETHMVIKEHEFLNVLNKITFGAFFKNSTEVTIYGSDYTSGLSKLEYQTVSSEDQYKEDGEWTTYEYTNMDSNEENEIINISANQKDIIYVRVVDKAGNKKIINSNGIVVYTDATIATTTVKFDKNTLAENNKDVTVELNLNGNTLKGIYNNDTELVVNVDYTMQDNIVTIKKEYLENINEDILSLKLKFNPLGESYTQDSIGDAPIEQEVKIEITAKVIVPNVYNINFVLDGGTNYQNPPTQYNEKMDSIPLGTPTKTGYIFDGFYETNDFTGEVVTEIPSGSTGNKIFYAKWKEITAQDSDYKINTNNISSWSKNDLTITPSNGYTKISKVVDGKAGQWGNSILISQEGGDISVSFKLQKDDGTETIAKVLTGIKIDKSVPTAQIAIKENKFNSFLNSITFGTFFKETCDVIITADDNLSGVSKIEYQKVKSESDYNESANWTSYDKVKVEPNEKAIIYAKVSDNAGNISIVNSNGVVVYTDSAINLQNAVFDKNTTYDGYKDVEVLLLLNKNTLKQIKNGDIVLKKDVDYTLNNDKVVIKKEYLNGIEGSNLKLSFEFNPLDTTYDEKTSVGDKPIIAELNISIIKSKNKVKVSFDLNGGLGNKIEAIDAKEGDIITLPDGKGISKVKSIFTGWVDEKGNKIDSKYQLPDKDVVLKATWKQVTGTVNLSAFEKEYMNQNKITGKVAFSNTEGMNLEIKVLKDGTSYSKFVYDSSKGTIEITPSNILSKESYKVVATLYFGQDELSSSIISFDSYNVKTISALYNNQKINTVSINNNDKIEQAIKDTNSTNFYKAINNINLSRMISIAGGVGNNDQYEVTSSNQAVALVSENSLNSISLGSAKLVTGKNNIYINGLKDGTSIITIKHVKSGVSTTVNVNVSTLNQRLYVVNPVYTDGYNAYLVANNSGRNQFTNLLTKSDKTTNIKDLNWNFTADNNIKGVSLVKLSNGDVVLYNPSTKFTGLLNSNVNSSNTPISQKVDNMTTGESTSGSAYSKNVLRIIETYKMKLILKDISSKNIDSKVMIHGYLLKNGKIVEQLKKEYNGNVYKQKPTINFDFNTDNVGTLNKSDTLQVIYEVTSSNFDPKYISMTTYSDGKQQSTTIAAELNYGTSGTSVVFKDVTSTSEADVPNFFCLSDTSKTKILRVYSATNNASAQSSSAVKIGNSQARNTDRQNITLAGMEYTWYKEDIKINESNIKAGGNEAITVNLYYSGSRLNKTVTSQFKVVNAIGIPEPEGMKALNFIGNVAGGSFNTKAAGKTDIKFSLPPTLPVAIRYEDTDNPLSKTFAIVIGTDTDTDDKDPKNFYKTLEEQAKKLKDGASTSGGSVNATISGYAFGTVNYVNGKWVMAFSGGGVSGSLKFEYGYSMNTFIAFVPVYYGFKVGLKISADMLFAGKNSYHDLFNVSDYNVALDTIVGAEGSLLLEGGIGFDAKVIAIKFGAEGEIKIGYQHRVVSLLKNSSVVQNFQGGVASVYGALRLIFEARFLWWKYKVKLAEAAYTKSWQNGYSFPKGRPSGSFGDQDDPTTDGFSADFLKAMYVESAGSSSDDWTSSLYPYGAPVVASSGNSMALLYNTGNINNSKDILPAISSNDNGVWQKPEAITGWGEVDRVASSLDFDGGKVLDVAVFDAATYSDSNGEDTDAINGSMNSGEIYATTVKDGKKITTRLTNDNYSDSAPVVYVNGDKAVALWQKGNFEINKATGQIGYKEGDTLWYSYYDGNEWQKAKVLENGSIGNTQSYDVALAKDGTIMALTSKSSDSTDNLATREIVSYLVKDGNITREQKTSNELIETQPRLTTALLNEKEVFVSSYMQIERTKTEDSTDSSSKLQIQGFDTNGGKISGFNTSGNVNEISEKYDFVKSESKDINDLAISWTGYEVGGSCSSYAKLINYDEQGLSLSKNYTLSGADKGTAITSQTSNLINKDGNITINSSVLQQQANEDGAADNVEKTAFMKNAKVEISNKLSDIYADITGEKVIPESNIIATIGFKNDYSKDIKAVIVQAGDQVQTINTSVESGKYGEVEFNYSTLENVADVDLKITPILMGGKEGQTENCKLELESLNLAISNPKVINQESMGVRTLESVITNNGTKKMDGKFVIVDVTEGENKTSKVTTDSLGAEVLENGKIKISGKEAMAAIDAGNYVLTFKHEVKADSYDENGMKAMAINVFPYDEVTNKECNDMQVLNNYGTFGFVKPSLNTETHYQFEVSQKNTDITEADVIVKNLYETAAENNFKISLLDANSNIIEKKIVKLTLAPEEFKTLNVAFSTLGNEVAVEMTQEEVPAEEVKPGTSTSGDAVRPGTDTPGDAVKPGTDTPGDAVKLGTDTPAEEVNTLGGTEDGLNKNNASVVPKNEENNNIETKEEAEKATDKKTGSSDYMNILIINITSLFIIASIIGAKRKDKKAK